MGQRCYGRGRFGRCARVVARCTLVAGTRALAGRSCRKKQEGLASGPEPLRRDRHGIVALKGPALRVATKYTVVANFTDGFGQESIFIKTFDSQRLDVGTVGFTSVL
jgi:hypothetical protein